MAVKRPKRAGAAPRSNQASTRPAPKPRRTRTVTPRATPGTGLADLETQILAALGNAGETGIRLSLLAEKLGANSAGLEAWFQAALTRHPTLKKIGPGHYALEMTIPSLEIEAGFSSSRASVEEEQNLPLKARIQEALRAAGPNGATLQDLATQLGVSYKNIAAWFATAGRKVPTIQKAGPNTYRFAMP